MYSDYYVVDTSYGLNAATSAISGAMLAIVIIASIIGIALSILMIVSMWKVFKKKGKPGWASIIPVYNTYVMCEIAGLSWVYILLSFIPLVNIYAIIMIYNGLAKAFGKTTGFTVGLVLLPIIFFPILAFGKDESTQVSEQSANGEMAPVNQVPNENPIVNQTQEQSVPQEEPTGYDTPSFGASNDVKPVSSVSQPTQPAAGFNGWIPGANQQPSFGMNNEQLNVNQTQDNVNNYTPNEQPVNTPSFFEQSGVTNETNIMQNAQTYQNLTQAPNAYSVQPKVMPSQNNAGFNNVQSQTQPINNFQGFNSTLDNQNVMNQGAVFNTPVTNVSVNPEPKVAATTNVEPKMQNQFLNDNGLANNQNNNEAQAFNPQTNPLFSASNQTNNQSAPSQTQPLETLDMQEDSNQPNGNQNM